MNSRRLLSGTASLALAAAGFLAPAFITQESAALASPTVSTLASVPAQAPTSITPGTQALTQAATMPARRIRIRSHSNNPTITIISWILAILIVGGGILVRFVIFKATQRNSTPPTAFNGPNGPQYGVTGSNYGTPGTGYGTAGAGYGSAGTGYGTAGPGYGTAGAGYGTAADAAQPGSPAYGTGAYGNQQGGQGPYGTGF
jgi:dehydrin rab18